MSKYLFNKIKYKKLLQARNILEIRNYVETKILKGHGNFVRCLVKMSKTLIVSGSDDGTIKIWDTSTEKCLHSFYVNLPITSLLKLDDTRVISGVERNLDYREYTVSIWDIKKRKCLKSLCERSIKEIALLNDTMIACVDYDCSTIEIWDFRTKSYLRTLRGHKSFISCIDKLNETEMVSGSLDEHIKIWNFKGGNCITTLIGNDSSIKCLIKFNETQLVSGISNGVIKIWDIRAERCLNSLNKHGNLTIKIWNAKTGNCLNTLKGHSSSVRCLVKLSEIQIASGVDDGTLKIWDIKTGNCLNRLKGHNLAVNNLVVINEVQIASSSNDKSIILWNYWIFDY